MQRTERSSKTIPPPRTCWSHFYLVSGFKPFETCQSKWLHLLQIGVNIKHIWNHHLLLMEEILHRLIGSLSHSLQGFIHFWWCRISSINSSYEIPKTSSKTTHFFGSQLNPLPIITKRTAPLPPFLEEYGWKTRRPTPEMANYQRTRK